MAIEMDSLAYGTILNKPNQLIEINRCELNSLHNGVIDLCLHTCQSVMYVDREVKKKNFKVSDYYDMEFKIPLDEFLMKLKGKNYIVKNEGYVENACSDLCKILIKTKSKHSFTARAIFSIMDVNFKTKTVTFKLTTDIIKALNRESKFIGSDEEEENLEVESMYTSYDYVSINAYNFTSPERALYENLIKNFWQLFKFSRNSMSYELRDFLELVGIDSQNMPYIKRKIEDIVYNIQIKTGMELHYEYDLGKYKKINKVKFKILNFRKSNNREILHFFKNNEGFEEHKDNTTDNLYIDHFENTKSKEIGVAIKYTIDNAPIENIIDEIIIDSNGNEMYESWLPREKEYWGETEYEDEFPVRDEEVADLL